MERKNRRRVEPEAPTRTRYCSKCKKTSSFVCSGKFRVNANGKHLDVWLIYRCERCNTTWNQEIYARVKPSRIDKELYQAFVDNDWETALRYAGNNGGARHENQTQTGPPGQTRKACNQGQEKPTKNVIE